jgi:glucuronate isomerase
MTAFGRDKGFDIPTRTDYVRALKPLLDAVGLERDLTIILSSRWTRPATRANWPRLPGPIRR